jgi:hypothetical protein
MKTQTKIDLYKLHQAEYAATRKPALVELKPATYLAIAGQGAPGGEQFSASIGALYAMAFTIKMTRKLAGHQAPESATVHQPPNTPRGTWEVAGEGVVKRAA